MRVIIFSPSSLSLSIIISNYQTQGHAKNLHVSVTVTLRQIVTLIVTETLNLITVTVAVLHRLTIIYVHRRTQRLVPETTNKSFIKFPVTKYLQYYYRYSGSSRNGGVSWVSFLGLDNHNEVRTICSRKADGWHFPSTVPIEL